MQYITTIAWKNHLEEIIVNGRIARPRGKEILEVPQKTIIINMERPVIKSKIRMLSYRFMAAEAYWILTEDDRLESIAPYNKNISVFSDNGSTFFGAYGPKIMAQLPYVISKLHSDSDSRQAGLTIWRESPPESKDIPCTVAMFFRIVEDRLDAHVFMRSSDAWLGVPYDIFNFSMVAYYICGSYNYDHGLRLLKPGKLYLTMASAHLYKHNLDDAKAVVKTALSVNEITEPAAPEKLYYSNPCVLLEYLKNLRDSHPGNLLRWWEI